MYKIASNGTHHANLLVGLPEAAEAYLRSLCDGLGFQLANNPDFFSFRTETFGIDDARTLSMLAARKAISDRKIFLISAERLTLEAQNALLKTFEEPAFGTHFFLSVREEDLIAPTLRSRMEISRVSRVHTPTNSDAANFLALSLKDRLTFAKKFVDEEKYLPVFLDDLLLALQKRRSKKDLKNVHIVRRFASDLAAAPRLIVEHLSLVL